MSKQKINTSGLCLKDPGLYSKDTVSVIPTTQPHGLYFALRYLYTNDKDVNDWYRCKKNNEDYSQFWNEINGNYDPWHTTNFRNGVK